MLKISVDKARVHVRMRNRTEGSVLQDTVHATCLGFDTRVEIESSEPAERILRLLRTAERGCYTFQALQAPAAIARSATLNGAPLAVDDGPS
jgi:hypothetical protein